MPNNHSTTWVVVADNSKAKVFQVVKFPKLEEISFLEHPESRLLNQDLTSTKPGRGFQRVGYGRSAYQPEHEPKQVESLKFANQLSEFLSIAERNGQFQRLYVIAEPSFLGLFRAQVSTEVKNKIIAELNKEVTTTDIAVIEQLLSKMSP